MSDLMFGPAVVADADAADISVDVRTAGQVRLAVGPQAVQRAHLEPGAARALAAALLEAADVADLEDIEAATADAERAELDATFAAYGCES